MKTTKSDQSDKLDKSDMSAPDQAARDAIMAERRRNVMVVAGAGTGKTKTIIDRAVELLAPRDENVEPIPITRMAAITFTRRAAGELRFRIREQLLRELEREARRSKVRADRLREALGSLDAAFIGTIHGFADRLLRLRPVEADLSPAYALVEDTSELVRETLSRLRRGAESGTLAVELGRFGDGLGTLLDEAAETLRAAARSGLPIERVENSGWPLPSLEDTLARMIDTRDVRIDPMPDNLDPGIADARAAADQYAQLAATKLRRNDFGHRQLRRIASALRRIQAIDDPAEIVRTVNEALRGRPLYLGRDFGNDRVAWAVYDTIRPDRNHFVLERIKAPHRWLATRLVRLLPVAAAMYKRVKAEHEVVDYLDLLIKLRDLLRDKIEARRFYQGLFDHVFVDEFQDTDPLQCEIVFYLCEEPAAAEAAARQWDAVTLAAGKLTIVGDPKQSIYRFRRADIAMYSRAAQRLADNGALRQRLEANFRSRPELIAFFNGRLGEVLGRNENEPFDPESGRAHYEDLLATGGAACAACVHVLPYTDANDSGLLAQEGRAVEAAMLARYVRWLLASGCKVRDPDSGLERPVRPGDIAILACVTTNVRMLLRELDTLGIEYTARGGALFLAHPVVRQYLLALRALADRHDGVAEAALLRPPFFAVDCDDVAVSRLKRDKDATRARMREADDVVAELRRRRHMQPPGATARDLIERTALGRAVITGRNGAQTLGALYQVAAEIDRRSALESLDYDSVTEIARSWAIDPVFLDAAEPIGDSAVRVMTIHSAKGLEFPVAILWDGFQTFSDRGGGSWRVERDGRAWALGLGPVAIENRPGGRLLERERHFGEEERKRMYYVAATRARDLLVIPEPHRKGKRDDYASKALIGEEESAAVRRFDVFCLQRLPPWAGDGGQVAGRGVVGDEDLQRRLDAVARTFTASLQKAATPTAVPTAVTAKAAGIAEREAEIDAEADRLRKAAGSRFGPQFGAAVHRGLELLVGGVMTDASSAVTLAMAELGIDAHADEAVADVERARAALTAAGIDGSGAATVSTEYPLSMLSAEGHLLSGFIDLLAADDGTMTAIDFKTDVAPKAAAARVYPEYAAQLRFYGEMLRATGLVGGRALRLGLLFTESGRIDWVDGVSEAATRTAE
jgi:ATP-dependent helicase/nuclease subunit A